MTNTERRLAKLERLAEQQTAMLKQLLGRTEDRLLTLDEVVERLGWQDAPTKIYRYTGPAAARTKAGRLPTVRKGKQLFVTESSFNEWVTRTSDSSRRTS